MNRETAERITKIFSEQVSAHMWDDFREAVHAVKWSADREIRAHAGTWLAFIRNRLIAMMKQDIDTDGGGDGNTVALILETLVMAAIAEKLDRQSDEYDALAARELSKYFGEVRKAPVSANRADAAHADSI